MITQAAQSDLQAVYDIVQNTIAEIYPHYYPDGAVRFFQKHHSLAKIEQDMTEGNVYLLYHKNTPVGTVTLNDNEINRLFILPAYQSRRYGTMLMDFSERMIAEQFPYATLSSSFSAQEMYLKRGYTIYKYEKIVCDNGDFLCYFLMRKSFF